MLLKPALAIRETVTGHKLGALEGGEGGYLHPLPLHPCSGVPCPYLGPLVGGTPSDTDEQASSSGAIVLRCEQRLLAAIFSRSTVDGGCTLGSS